MNEKGRRLRFTKDVTESQEKYGENTDWYPL